MAGGAPRGAVAAVPAHTENLRGNNVRFLQEHNKEVLRALEKMEEERDEALQEVQQWEEKKVRIQEDFARLQKELADAEDRCNISAAEIHKRDEQIRVLSEQNRSLLDMLEAEEKNHKEKLAAWSGLTEEKVHLTDIKDRYDNIKKTGEEAMTNANTEIAKTSEELRNANDESDQLCQAQVNYLAQSKADVEALEKRLEESKNKNVAHLQQIQHNEVFEHRTISGLAKLKELLEDLTVQKRGMRMQLDTDSEQRDRWTQSRSEIQRRHETLEKTVAALRASLRSAEESNSQMQDENKRGADNFREMGDKVYALMDQLRVHQVELKKVEQGGIEKTKKITEFEKQSQTLQQKLVVEVDAKLAAESEARSAAQMQALLQKKNKMLDEALALALKSQEKIEKRWQELQDKANALQDQSEYLGTRIDGQEEDKGALRHELRRLEDELRQATTTHIQLSEKHGELDDKVNQLEADKTSIKAELDYIRREDMLDETGRTKPILIESNESKLIERLQINEFLYSAQQARNPVPMLIEKVSHMLELLHTAQIQSDLYLQDLQRSNSLLTALRQKNMVLYERTQMCETWKLRALLKIASNEFETRDRVKGHVHGANTRGGGHVLYLDGLQYTLKELQELKRLITSYGKQESVVQIRLQDNQLDYSSVTALCELITLCPYLRRLDLKSNRFSEDAINEMQYFVERIQGVTVVNRDPVNNDLKVKTGNQLRLEILLDEQSPEATDRGIIEAAGQMNPEQVNGADADDFLSSAAGKISHPRLQGTPSAKGAGKTLLPAIGSVTQLPAIRS